MAEPFQQLTESNLVIQKWQEMNPGLKAGFTMRHGGYSEAPYDSLNLGLHVPDHAENVMANRRKLADIVRIPLDRWVSGEQTHQTNVQVLTGQHAGQGALAHDTSLEEIDGLITGHRGILCTAFFADCVPVYFFDPASGYIGIAHAGWKGTVHRICQKMVETFEALGVDPGNILVTIGPCISRNVYEVDEHVVSHIPDELLDKTVEKQENNRYLLDLKHLNKEILLQHGVLHRNIDVTSYCTFRHDTLFFSHRRDQGKTGRMLGYIGYEN